MNKISTQRHLIEGGHAAETIGFSVVRIAGEQPGPTLTLLSGIHGDEWEGVTAAGRLCHTLRDEQLHGQIVIVSICNEAAFDAMSRTSPQDGMDLARCFPGNSQGSSSERLAAVLTEKVIRQADFLIDLHSAGLHYTMPTLVGFMDEDSEMGRQSTKAGLCFGAPVLWRHPSPPPAGRTISAAYQYGIPWIYAETTGAGELRARDIDCYTRGVRNILHMLTMLPGETTPQEPVLRLAGTGDLDTSKVRASQAGIVIRSVELLQTVEPGDEVGTIINPAGEIVERLRADQQGIVVMLRHTPRVMPGDRICHLAELDH